MASTVHKPSSQCSSMTCVYYPKTHHIVQYSRVGELKPCADIYDLCFPRFCSHCSTLEIEMDDLCPFCQHLRLQHLIYCLQDHESRAYRWLVLGRFEDLGLRFGCTFCTFIGQLVSRESQSLHVIVYGSDFVMLSLDMTWISSNPYSAISTPDSFGNGHVEVCSGSQHTSIDSFTADENWYLLHKFDAKFCIRPRGPPDEPNGLGAIVNWQPLRNWIKECTDNHMHDDPIHPPRENGLGRLLFIDVEKCCIVSASSSCNYIALSYVWGSRTADMIETTKQSIDNLRQVGSLLGHRIPATIRDAMITCRQLGVLYLWVDRFCIVQDDELQKHEQIRSMGTIYSYALLTICATAGDNADRGLPGVQSKSRFQIPGRMFAFGVQLVHVRRNYGSIWNSRAWTYQEMVLSRRRLVFTSEEVFFECNQGVSAEVSAPMEPPSRFSSLNGFNTKVESYMNHVKNYTRRILSYRTDIYNAFAGVGGSLYPSQDLIHGFPTSAFDDAILWESLFAYNDDRWPRQKLRKDLYLPSWSWASEFGNTVSYDTRFPVFGSFAKWSFIEQQEQAQVIESVDTPIGWHLPSAPFCHDPRLYLALAWRERVIENAPSLTISWNRPFGEIESYVIKGWPTYRNYWEEAHGRARFGMNAQTKLAGRLLLRTSVALLGLEAAPEECRISKGGISCVVYADDDYPCGFVSLPYFVVERGIPETGESVPMIGRAKVQLMALSCTYIDALQFQSLYSIHCMLLRKRESAKYRYSVTAVAIETDFPASLPGPKEPFDEERITPKTTYYDSQNSPLDPPPAIRVMMISWRGDVAYRVGLGVVYLRQWNSAKPTFRTIILE